MSDEAQECWIVFTWINTQPQHCWTLTTSTHPHSREYTEHPWEVYASVLGVSCPSLLHWCSQCCMCCSTASHCWTLSSHITYMHINTQYALFCNTPLSRMQSIPEKFMIHLTELGTVSSSHVRWSIRMLNSVHVNKYTTSFAVHITNPLL